MHLFNLVESLHAADLEHSLTYVSGIDPLNIRLFDLLYLHH